MKRHPRSGRYRKSSQKLTRASVDLSLFFLFFHSIADIFCSPVRGKHYFEFYVVEKTKRSAGVASSGPLWASLIMAAGATIHAMSPPSSSARVELEKSIAITAMLATARAEARIARIRLTGVPLATAALIIYLTIRYLYVLIGVSIIGALYLPAFLFATLLINLSMLPSDKTAIKSIVIFVSTCNFIVGLDFMTESATAINGVITTTLSSKKCRADAISLMDDERNSVDCGYILLHEMRWIVSGAACIFSSVTLLCGWCTLQNKSGRLLNFYMKCM